MMRSAKTRALIVCGMLAICFTAFSARLVDLQVSKHSFYASRAYDSHVRRATIVASRGRILDVNSEPLAENDPVMTLVADGSLVMYPERTAALLTGPLGKDEGELLEILSQKSKRPIPLKKKLPAAISNTVMRRLFVQGLRGVYPEPDAARAYPNGSMLCHVIGFTNGEQEGVQGIEGSMDKFLRGYDGFRYLERDRTGKEIVVYRGEERAARDGCNVRLTIDLGLQQIVEDELDAAMAKFRPQKAIAILMRPKTGEILAMANRPKFDLNDLRMRPAEFAKMDPESLKNAAVIDMTEPGSTFKIVTASAALNEGVVTPETEIFCENGKFTYASKTLHDHHGYGDLNVEGILMKSSNIGAAKLALRLGDQKFYEYIRRFGFGERTGVSLPGEINGRVNAVHLWKPIDTTRIAMGQSVGVTPLQSIAAMAAIANGGKLMMPQIVRDVTDRDGNIIASFPPVQIREVITPATAREITRALKNVVSEKGTAVGARVEGFVAAGKTGTAQKISPTTRGYLSGQYILSFVGYLPADDPEFVALVMVDNPNTTREMNYGGTLAGPIFASIAQKAARHLNLQPAPEVPPGKLIITQRER